MNKNLYKTCKGEKKERNIGIQKRQKFPILSASTIKKLNNKLTNYKIQSKSKKL